MIEPMIESKPTLYDCDFNLWLEEAITHLKVRDFQNLDIKNLVEELEGLSGRDRREIKQRLTTLIEHLLKRCYVKSEYDYAGWVETIDRTRNALRDIFKQSPSLKNYASNPDLFEDAFADALRIVRRNRGYKSVNFPDRWQFSSDINSLLTIDFWEIFES